VNDTKPQALSAHTAIDIHTHIVPFDFPAAAGRSAQAQWPQMVAGQTCQHRNVMIDGKVFRTVTEEAWSVERRLEHMAASGIGRQVLSPMPELLSYWLPTEEASVLCRHVNDAIAGMVAQRPQHFCALGCVPLQDPALAARELERLMAMGTFRGVELGTNINGTAIGDPKFEEFYAAAEALGASLFVHPLHPSGMDRLVGPPALVQLVAFPSETALSVASLITGGVLERHPKLRIAISHGGGGFALTLPRLAFGWGHISQKPGARSPLELAQSLFYDTLVYDTATLRYLIGVFGKTQLCIGTDHPFVIQDPRPMLHIDELDLNEADKLLLTQGNARRFLGEPVLESRAKAK
jgi:aminocarboxymuconate-semialdehyde decarboxylase